MKMYLVALAAVVTMSAAAPAYAAYVRETPRDQTRHEQMSYPQMSQLSEHCRDVLSRQDMWGEKEVQYCQNSL